ncbi:DUF1801 domain-containing protein [Streptomyces sp. NPDC005096]|uniref:DUF1801 domain-containing protein n=1 Tax=Streptomyces sp. NPDC005096 TaxID=3154559 RepID=UPI0033AE396D
MDKEVRDHIDGIPAEHRPLYDRLHRLILEAHPGAAVVISYKIPTYKVGSRRLYVGAWNHGVSLYGRQPVSPPATPRSPRAGRPSGYGPTTRLPSPMTSFVTWRRPPWTTELSARPVTAPAG